ncbi:MAG: amidohydrolase family protein [Planctomycetota bacterium]|jgi:imidazolonepropionase-like amidohydrolase
MRPSPTRPAWRAGSSLPLVLPLILAALATPSFAQEKTTTKPTEAAGKTPAKTDSQPGDPRRRPRGRGQGRRGRGVRRQLVALKVGTIHPVSGPDIQDGVILVRGGRIQAVGAASEVQVPASAKVIEYPDGHAYPGLVDAMSSAFAASTDLNFSGSNAGSDFKDALDRDHKPSRKIVEAGITTAYVSNRAGTTWRGLGVIIRPRKDGFLGFRDKRHGGVQMRMTTGTGSSHALSRQKQLAGYAKPFDALEAYEKKFKDHEKAMTEYKKKYKEYLDYFRKKKKAKAGAGGRRAPGGRRGPRTPTKKPGEGAKKTPAAKTPPVKKPPEKKEAAKKPPAKTTPKPAPGAAKPAGKPGAKDPKAPTKPKYPKPIKKVPATEALLKVKRGDLPLRVEAHRKDEIRAVLKMAREKEIPQVMLEHATEAGGIAKELVDAGVPVVVTELLPAGAKGTYLHSRDGSLPGKLHQAGVAVAIASGGGGAEHLTMKAAWACGKGMPEDAAIRAITLTPAEVLGVENHVGSLDRGKVADVLITSGPLLQSDTRVLRVISQGQTQFESKEAK